jgi:hypothetical protein
MMRRIHIIEIARQAEREKRRQEKEYEKTLKKGLTGRGLFGMIKK